MEFQVDKKTGILEGNERSYRRDELQNLCLKIVQILLDWSISRSSFSLSSLTYREFLSLSDTHPNTNVLFTALVKDALRDTEKELMSGSHRISSRQYSFVSPLSKSILYTIPRHKWHLRLISTAPIGSRMQHKLRKPKHSQLPEWLHGVQILCWGLPCC